jgi:hypothetical protein
MIPKTFRTGAGQLVVVSPVTVNASHYDLEYLDDTGAVVRYQESVPVAAVGALARNGKWIEDVLADEGRSKGNVRD